MIAAIALGAHLYAVHCSSCHGAHMEGTVQAPSLRAVDAALVDFELRTGRMPTQGPYEQEYDATPQLNREQIAAIVAFVASKSSGERSAGAVLPPPQQGGAASAPVRAGRETFEENCEQCHSATGRGDGATAYRDVAPELMNADATTIAEAVREGPGVMPKFGTRVVDDRQLAELTAYIGYLQHGHYNPGGLQLANWGPVSEGFIAWVFGLGLLLLFTRRIGEG